MIFDKEVYFRGGRQNTSYALPPIKNERWRWSSPTLCHRIKTFILSSVCDVVASYDALCHHGLGNLEESSHVGTLYVVDVAIGLCAVLHAVGVDVVHDVVQFGIYFLAAPAQTL